jgi:hypothetical protein
MAGRANVRIASAKNFNAGILIGWGFFFVEKWIWGWTNKICDHQ